MAKAKTVAETPEKKIEAKQNSIVMRISQLQDPETKVLRVRNQREADNAGSLVYDIGLLRAQWRLEWYGTKTEPGTIPKADQVHKDLVARFRKLDKPMAEFEMALKLTANAWQAREQERLDAEARKINAEEQEKHPESIAVYQAPKVAVEGLAAKDVKDFEIYWCEGEQCKCKKMFGENTIRAIHETQGKIRLARAVGAGKVTSNAIDANESFIRLWLKDNFDGAEEINGEKYLFPGVRVWKGSRMDRRSL